ncbi:MAG: DUF1622 domain-containing protein [Caulobacterales bacterium]|nr:DUF1622 domain-containing protein [Caulobacterales bacterium]
MSAPAHAAEPMIEANGPLSVLVHWLEHIAVGIDLIGVAIILFGFVVSLIKLLQCLAMGAGLRRGVGDLQDVRLQLGVYILVGIEFMIASDIIHTVLTRELSDLAFVGALVAIRTAISFFLGRELAEVRERVSRAAPSSG